LRGKRLLAWGLAGATAAGLGWSAGTPAGADDRRPTRRQTRYEDDLGRRAAIRRGCQWIAQQQGPTGAFGDQDNAIVALTALSVLALMSDGSTDARGPYGKQVRRGIDFLVSLVEAPRLDRPPNEEGYFFYKHDNNSRMHGQGYATLAVASALGTSDGERAKLLHSVLRKAVRCIEQAQTESGGFGYDPVGNKDHEGSVTVTVAQGLRAARDVGVHIDREVVAKGLRYLKRSQRSDAGDLDGSFRYSLHHERTSYALTAAALSSFFLYGQYSDDADRTIQRGLRFLMGPKGLTEVMRTKEWWSYGHFYAAWALWQHDGDRWEQDGGHWGRWHRVVFPRILEDQRSDGSWQEVYDRFEFGPLLPTCFAVLTLAIPDEVLPIFQR
jgi:hypothetical protein